MTPTPGKVLIVDDDPAVVEALSAHFSELGFEVQTAENGLQAILRATRNPPRLAVIDLNMPEVDGFRVCEWLLDPKRPAVEIIMLTARADSEAIDRCGALGVHYVLKGAETWNAIHAVLNRALSIKHLSDAAVPAPLRQATPKTPFADVVRNKVLIVEDDGDLARGLARRLQKCGATTLVATDGVSGYRLATREQPNVIITDYTMPEGSGHYLIWRLKTTESTKHIPIIVMTGQRPDPNERSFPPQDVVGNGVPVRIFQKPLNMDAMLNEVSKHCTIQYAAFEKAH